MNRLIPSAPYEIEINFISNHIRYYMRNSESLEEKEYYLFTYYSIINPTQLEWTKEYYNKLDENGKIEFMKNLEDNGIPVIQPPFWDNITLETLTELYDTFPEIREYKLEGIKNPMIVGEMYVLTLKHDPKGKMSIRSTGFNSITGLPAKSKMYKDHKIPYSNTPIRIGEMEVTNALLTKDNTIQNLLYSYATDDKMRSELLDAIIEDPFSTRLDFSNMGLPLTARIARSLFKCLGLEIYDEEEEI